MCPGVFWNIFICGTSSVFLLKRTIKQTQTRERFPEGRHHVIKPETLKQPLARTAESYVTDQNLPESPSFPIWSGCQVSLNEFL